MAGSEREYFQAVEAAVTAARGRGYALSGLEATTVLRWWQEGVPLRHVLTAVAAASNRALRQGHADRLSLHAVARELEHLAACAARDGARGGEEAQPEAAAARGHHLDALRMLIEDVGRRLEDGPAREAWRAAWRALPREPEPGEDPFLIAARLDDAVARALIPHTPPEILEAAVSETRGRDDLARASPAARDDAERLARAAAMRSYFGLPELLEALLT
jgi:hypothetical protein